MRRIRFQDTIVPSGARRNLRRWLPYLVFGASSAIAAGFWLVVARQNHREFAAYNRQTAVSTQLEIATRLQARLRNLSAFSKRWEQWGEPAAGRWEFDARLFEKNYPECRSIVLTDADARVRRSVESAPGSDRARASGSILFSDLTPAERASLAVAARTGTPIILPCREHGPDNPSLQVILPLLRHGRNEGFFVASFDSVRELQTVSQHLVPATIWRYTPEAIGSIAAPSMSRLERNRRGCNRRPPPSAGRP